MAPEHLELSNGWTQYQKLVLAELTRHENTIGDLKEEYVDQKVAIAEIKLSLQSIGKDIIKIRDTQLEIDKFQKKQTEEFDKEKLSLKDRFNDHKMDLERLKWKVTGVLSVFIFVINAVIQIAGKSFKWW